MRLPDFVTTWLLAKLRARCENRRPPDVHIGGKRVPEMVYADRAGNPRARTPIYDGTYMERWWVIPRNKLFNMYFHKIMRSDDDRALHDHPWWNISIILAGRYWEILPVDQDDPQGLTYPQLRKRGEIVIRRKPTFCHRLQLLNGLDGEPRPVWTLFITGPYRRVWGFWCPQGWKDFREFTGSAKGGHSYEGNGPGCGED